MAAEAQNEAPPDPKDLKIKRLEKEKLELLELNDKLDKRVDEIIQEQSGKVDEIRGQYTELFQEHEALKEDYKAKEDEARYFMNELQKYKEQYDEKLVQRLTDQIDSLSLDVTMVNMKNNDITEEVTYLRKENIRLKTEWQIKQIDEFES